MALPESPTLSDGQQIGVYAVVRLMGRGGMGNVFEARHCLMGRPVAIKVLHSHLARDAVAAARFLREGQAIARIRHPNVVEIFDMGTHEGLPYLVMELVDGVDLATHLRQQASIPIVSAVDCILDVLAGTAAAHDAGVVHRDLKPSNVRFATNHLGERRAKVLDFGISKWNGDLSALTESNGTLGTTSYMAPEQFRAARECDARTDIYALGVILYECLTGRLPFHGDSPYERMHAVLTGPLAPPRLLRPEIAPALEALVVRAMSREPDRRFASAREFGRALAPFATEPSTWLREFTRGAARVSEVARIDIRNGDPTPSVRTITMTAFATGRSSRRSRLTLVACIAAGLVSVATVAWHGRRAPRLESERPARSEAREAVADRPQASLSPSTEPRAPTLPSAEPTAPTSATDLVAPTPSRTVADRSVPSAPERPAQGPLRSSPPRAPEPRPRDTAPKRGSSALYDQM
jgi:serine/threonine-protein kinase